MPFCHLAQLCFAWDRAASTKGREWQTLPKGQRREERYVQTRSLFEFHIDAPSNEKSTYYSANNSTNPVPLALVEESVQGPEYG